MNMPASTGLYSKVMIMSGTMGHQLTDAGRDMSKNVERMLEVLGINNNEIEKIHTFKQQGIADAYLNVHIDHKGIGMPFNGPTKNVDYLGDPVYLVFSEQAKKIPMIVGSVFAEFFTFSFNFM
ncbi:MAG: hypothetical protein VB009_04125 [Erysipelotrichaceae bacterium]|nr:hypothetical protein [Erysipelotrichaceae bacterium]